MKDESYLDKQYFIDPDVYNCPFCNRKNVVYERCGYFEFDWSKDKRCYAYLVQCTSKSCQKVSMHLSFSYILDDRIAYAHEVRPFKQDIEIDSYIFYSVPTSFFVIDSRIPKLLRELVAEAEGCLKMNYLTGASACMRKAIYELLVIEKAEGKDYQGRIKSLKYKYPQSDPNLFDILASIQDMTSDKIHEQSWDKWDSNNLKLIIETLKTVLYDIYVLPKEKEERSLQIQKLRETISKDKKDVAKST
jgi:hypothetical protein